MRTILSLLGSRFVSTVQYLIPGVLELIAVLSPQAFIILEVVFQLPTFFVGIKGLYKGSTSIYPLLALYAASSATTTYACLATVLTMPGISQPHLVKLLASYVPFLLIPLAMAVDFGLRLTEIAQREEKGKRKAA
jgi:hypothetical protein